MPWWQAWTITAIVEGLVALMLVVRWGWMLPVALTLTWLSAVAGLAHMADEAAAKAGRVAGWRELAGAVVYATLAVVALGLTHLAVRHYIRERDKQRAKRRATEQAEQERAAELARQAAEAERQHQLELQRAATEQAERERRDAERAAAAERAHQLELQRSRAFAEQETARLALEAERIRAAQDQARAEAERAQAETERARALAEQARAATERQRALDEQRRADSERARQVAEQQRAKAERAEQEYRERLRADRRFARSEWIERQWDAEALAGLLGISPGRARALVAEWRADLASAVAIGA